MAGSVVQNSTNKRLEELALALQQGTENDRIQTLQGLFEGGVALVERLVTQQSIEGVNLTSIVKELDKVVSQEALFDHRDLQIPLCKTYRLFLELLMHQKQETRIPEGVKASLVNSVGVAVAFFEKQKGKADIEYEYRCAKAAIKALDSEAHLLQQIASCFNGGTTGALVKGAVLGLPDFLSKRAPEPSFIDLHRISFLSLCAKTREIWERLIPEAYRLEGERSLSEKVNARLGIEIPEELKAINLFSMCTSILSTPGQRDKGLQVLAHSKIIQLKASTEEKVRCIAESFCQSFNITGERSIPVDISPEHREANALMSKLEVLSQPDKLITEVGSNVDKLYAYEKETFLALLLPLIEATPNQIESHCHIKRQVVTCLLKEQPAQIEALLEQCQHILTYSVEDDLEYNLAEIQFRLFEYLFAQNGPLLKEFDEAMREGQERRAQKVVDQFNAWRSSPPLKPKAYEEAQNRLLGRLRNHPANALRKKMTEALDALPIKSEVSLPTLSQHRNRLKHYREAFSKELTSELDIGKLQDDVHTHLRLLLQSLLDHALELIGPSPLPFSVRLLDTAARMESMPHSPVHLLIFVEVPEDKQVSVGSLEQFHQDYFYQFNKVLKLLFTPLGDTATGLTLGSSKVIISRMESERTIELCQQPSLHLWHAYQHEALCHPPHGDRFEAFCKEHLQPSSFDRNLINLLKGYVAFYNHVLKKDQQPSPLNSEIIADHYIFPLTHLLSDLRFYFGLQATAPLGMIDEMELHPDSKVVLKSALETLYVAQLQLVRKNSYEPSIHEWEKLQQVKTLVIQPLYHSLEQILAQHTLDEMAADIQPILPRLKELFKGYNLLESALTTKMASIQDASSLNPMIRAITSYPIQGHETYYRQLSTLEDPKDQLRAYYLDRVKSPEVVKSLSLIPNPSGLRQSTLRDEKHLLTTLEKFVQADRVAQTTSQGTRTVKLTIGETTVYLKPEYMTFGSQGLFQENGDIRSRFGKEALHNVNFLTSEGDAVFLKQYPTHPAMEKAIHALTERMAGPLTPAVELIRMTVTQELKKPGGQVERKEESYPVLISQGVEGNPLDKLTEPLSWNSLSPAAKKQWTWAFLCALLTKPGDGRFSNYILAQDHKVYCVDNDISFAQLNVASLFRDPKHAFCSSLFLAVEGVELDRDVLTEFVHLSPIKILDGWVGDLLKHKSAFEALFRYPGERARLYNHPNEHKFRVQLLLQEGTLATLQLQFAKLQRALGRALHAEIPVRPIPLLKELVGFFRGNPGHVGEAVYSRYEEAMQLRLHERMALAAARNTSASISSHNAEKSCFGETLTFDRVESWPHSIERMRKELSAFSWDQDGPMITAGEGEHVRLQADFQAIQDLQWQEQFLKACVYGLSLKNQHPSQVAIRNCPALRTETLKPLLHANLKLLDLSYCPNILDSDIELVSQLCPNLEELILSHCNGLQQIQKLAERKLFAPNIYVGVPFPKLKSLVVGNCPSLKSVSIGNFTLNADQLTSPIKIERSEIENRSLIPGGFSYFGREKWKKYFGYIGAEPPLPSNIAEILNSPCPYWEGKTVAETHMLTLIPATLNGSPFTLNLLGQIIQNPQGGGHTAKYYWEDTTVLKEIEDVPNGAATWSLITKDVLPGSRRKTYAAQTALLKSEYSTPKALELATAILMHQVQIGEKLYSVSPVTFSRCEEKVHNSEWRVDIGSFGASGLDVDHFDDDGNDFLGLAGSRKF